MSQKTIRVGAIEIANDKPMVLFGGMNVLESRDLALRVCEEYVRAAGDAPDASSMTSIAPRRRERSSSDSSRREDQPTPKGSTSADFLPRGSREWTAVS